MPLDQRIRKLGAPLYGLLKKMRSSSTRKQSSVLTTYSRVVRTLNVYWRPPLPSLPVELWMKIIHELGHKEWIELCSVCWLLHQIAQPCLYEDIELRNYKAFLREISIGRFIDTQSLFKRTIDQRRELGAYVRNLTLPDLVDERTVPGHWKQNPLLLVLHLFPNLESLHVYHIHFDLELCNILHSHPHLKSVTVASCTLHESLAVAGIDQDHFPHSSISTVNVSNPKNYPLTRGWAALAPAKLETLVLYTSQESDADSILNRIRESSKTSFLTTLHLDTFSLPVVRFLIASPQLRHFILDTWMDEYDLISSSLPADAIPFLEEYNGPAEISSTFIRGRPVHTVNIFFLFPIPEGRLVEILISLQYCSVPLTSLEISLSNATVGSWLSHIPVTVRHLTFAHLNLATFTKWLPALSHLTSLRTLSCWFSWQGQKKLHRDKIMQISNACPSLREINVGRQKWRISGQRVWEPFTVLL